MAAKKSLYEILGVEPDANDLDIGLAFQRRNFELQRIAQPDPNAIALVQQAHEILSNPKRRAAYDAARVTAAEKAAAADQEPDLVIEEGDEEEAPRRKWLVPAIVAAVIVVAAGFFALKPGPAPQQVEPAPVAEAPKPAPPPPPQPMTRQQVLTAALRATGQLLAYDMSGAAVPVGLAVSLDPGTVVTTCHGVTAGSKTVLRQGADTLSAELTVADEVLDLCRFTVPGLAAGSLAIAADEPRAGDRIHALGVNAKGEFALTDGTVKQVRMAQNVKVLELSLPIAAGGSGGPVMDDFGRVVGIATTPHRYGAGINAAISSAWISQMRSRERAQ
jgi:S1-C subfamily serine protease